MKEYKIKVLSVQHSRAIQTRLYELGYKTGGVWGLEYTYIYTFSCGDTGKGNDAEEFNDNSNKEITITDLFIEPRFKIGDWVHVEAQYSENHWIELDQRGLTFEITKEPSHYSGGELWGCKYGGLVVEEHLRLATPDEIEVAKKRQETVLPIVNRYQGEFHNGNFGCYISFGCAKIPITWFECPYNRHIQSMTLNTGVKIEVSHMKQIVKYLIENKKIEDYNK